VCAHWVACVKGICPYLYPFFDFIPNKNLSTPICLIGNSRALVTRGAGGKAHFSTIAQTGYFVTVAWIAGSLVSPLPAGDYPFGFFRFVIDGGLSPSETATITIVFPNDLPKGTVWVKVEGGTYRVISAAVEGATLWLTLTADANRSIIDPGVPGVLVGAPVGGYVTQVNKLSIVASYLAFFETVAALAFVVVTPGKKTDS